MRTMSANEPGRWRRIVSGLFLVWAWGFALAVIVGLVTDLPFSLTGSLAVLFFALALVRAPRRDDEPPVEVASPVRGRWTVVHSPASKVPSHGVRGYGQSHAVDIIHPRPAGTTPSYPLVGGFRRPEGFSSFGRPVHAVADGEVVRVVTWCRDHRSRTSWLAFVYLFVVEGFRDLGGAPGVVGNHVTIDHGNGVHSLYAHLRRGSVRVAVGDRVSAGDVIGEVGNSGNTSEPHLHFQLMDRPSVMNAAGLPFRFTGIRQREGDVDRGWSRAEPQQAIVPALPANFQIFEA